MRGERLRQAKKKARRVMRSWRANQDKWSRERDGDIYADDGPIGQLMRFTRCPCSCIGCGNQRRWEGPTRQERRADADLQAEFDAWDQLSDEAFLNIERQASAQVRV